MVTIHLVAGRPGSESGRSLLLSINSGDVASCLIGTNVVSVKTQGCGSTGIYVPELRLLPGAVTSWSLSWFPDISAGSLTSSP